MVMMTMTMMTKPLGIMMIIAASVLRLCLDGMASTIATLGSAWRTRTRLSSSGGHRRLLCQLEALCRHGRGQRQQLTGAIQTATGGP